MDDLFQEIMDSPGEIYDIIDYDDESETIKEEDFNVIDFIGADYEY